MIAKVIKMEKIVEQTMLYDFYGELLTNHQRQIYEDAVLHDLSLSEIAEAHGISRQGVHDLIKRCNKTLADYEKKLHLLEKFLKTKEQIELIHHLVTDKNSSDYNKVMKEIRRISSHILEEL